MNINEIYNEILENSQRFIANDTLVEILDKYNLDIIQMGTVIEFLQDKGFVFGNNIQELLSKPDSSSEQHRSKNTTFEMLNLPLGSELVYIKDHNITAKTLDFKNKIELSNGRIGSISSITRDLETERGATEGPKQGARYWLYKGKTLYDIRKALEK